MLNKALGDVVLLFDGILAAGAAEVFFHYVKTLGIGQMFRHNYCFFDRPECQLFSGHVTRFLFSAVRVFWHRDASMRIPSGVPIGKGAQVSFAPA